MVNVRTIIAVIALALPASAQSFSERAIQECACTGMELEVPTGIGTRIDCLSETHAIEVEALQDWIESIGQSLHYAARSNRKAKVLFFCEQEQGACNRHWLAFQETVSQFDLPIESEMVSDHCEQQGIRDSLDEIRPPSAANTPQTPD